jgi:EpsD family peptidyl-prolyl cis-trans isomerase
MPLKKSALNVGIVISIVIMAGCGKGGDSAKPASQVAAKVNGDEISVHQINGALSKSGAISPDQAKKVAPQVLERIIDQQLLVQKAIEAKLDRDPQTMQNLENARRQILSQAYMEKTMAAVAKGGKDEIRKFYDENPALFQERRIYRFQELSVTGLGDRLSELRTEAEKAKSLADVATWLKGKNMAFSAANTTKAAEQLPLDLLPQVSKMRDGQIAVLAAANGSGAAVFQLVQSQQVPLNEQQATPVIEQFINNKKRMELAEAEVKKLRGAAKIEYVGDFVATKPGETAIAAPVAAIPAKIEPAPVVPAVATRGDSALEKGISGLK